MDRVGRLFEFGIELDFSKSSAHSIDFLFMISVSFVPFCGY